MWATDRSTWILCCSYGSLFSSLLVYESFFPPDLGWNPNHREELHPFVGSYRLANEDTYPGPFLLLYGDHCMFCPERACRARDQRAYDTHRAHTNPEGHAGILPVPGGHQPGAISHRVVSHW